MKADAMVALVCKWATFLNFSFDCIGGTANPVVLIM